MRKQAEYQHPPLSASLPDGRAMPPNASCKLHHAFPTKRDCVPYDCKPKLKLLALFHVKCFVMATRKGKACMAYPRTIRKAPILYITIFLTIQFWVYSLLPRDFEHINSLHYHTQCCFVKEGCNLIFLFLWVICVLSLKACKRIPLFLWYPLMFLKNVSVWGHLPCSAALGVLSVQNPFFFCDLLR